MARIRSVKPRYFNHATIKKIGHGAALFYIGLWTICDDEGKVPNNVSQFAHDLSNFRSQDIQKWVSILKREGLIQSSLGADWIAVTNWKHQKISKPVLPAIKRSEIEWLEPSIPGAFQDYYESVPEKVVLDRIGKDRKRIGKDLAKASAGLFETQTPGLKTAVVKIPKEQTPSAKVWNAYSTAYENRYRAKPPSNAKNFGICKHFVGRIPAEEAPEVARFYLSHNSTFYVSQLHPLSLMLRDAEKLSTEWKVGRQMTTQNAKQVEIQSANQAAAEEFLNRIGEGL